MMVFQHGPIIVQHGHVGTGVYVKTVCGARVLVVMNQGGNQNGENLQIGQIVHDTRLAQHIMNGLRYVGCVQIVVIWILVAAIAFLNFNQKLLENGGRHLEFMYDAITIQ